MPTKNAKTSSYVNFTVHLAGEALFDCGSTVVVISEAVGKKRDLRTTNAWILRGVVRELAAQDIDGFQVMFHMSTLIGDGTSSTARQDGFRDTLPASGRAVDRRSIA